MTFCLRKILLLFLILVSISPSLASVAMQDGQVRLSLEELESGTVKLRGEVHFYSGHLYTSDDIIKNSVQPSLMLLGSSWSSIKKGYPKFDSYGFGTYNFKLRIPDELVGETFILRPEEYISYASKIIVNNIVCGGNGMVGTSADDPLYAPSRFVQVQSFTADTCVLDIVIQCANFTCEKGGIFRPLSFSLEEQMFTAHYFSIFIDFTVIFSLLIMAFYHLVTYFIEPKEKKPFYYALMCIVLALSLRGEVIFLLLFPHSPIAYYLPFSSIITFSSPFFVLLFLGAFFPVRATPKLKIISLVFTFILSLAVIFGDVSWTRYLMYVFYIGCVFFIFRGFLFCHKLVKHEENGAWLFSSSYSFFVLCIINDILYTVEFIHTTNMLSVGVLFFMLILAIIHGKEQQGLHENLISLTNNLALKKSELEKEVNLRKVELKASMGALQELHDFQEGVTKMIADDLNCSIAPFAQVENIDKAEYPKLKQSGYLMLNLVQNILDIYRFNNNKMPVQVTTFGVVNIIDDSIRNLAFIIKRMELKVEVLQKGHYELKGDRYVFQLVFTNLLMNAIDWSPQKGLVQIRLSTSDENTLKVSVSREGSALPKRLRKDLFKPNFVFSELKTSFVTKSLLRTHLCKVAVLAHHGVIDVEADEVNPPMFWFALPGIVINKNQAELAVETNSFRLSKGDRMYLRPFVHLLLELEVFDLSRIEAVIDQALQSSESITQWCHSLVAACYELDEEAYKALLDLINTDECPQEYLL